MLAPDAIPPSPTEVGAPADLLVVGGGINGAGVARDAAGRGLSVVLCEKDDLSEGTSARSGKYIHGGLRYLEQYEFRLVREALAEREVILELAPHLAWPLRLVLVHSPALRPRWLIRLGLLLYDRLGGRRRVPGSAPVDLRTGHEGKPIRDEFASAFAYWDVWADDSRLVALNAVDAARRGARILTRTAFVSARRDDGLWRAILRDRSTGEETQVAARAIFNAAGPWVESVLSGLADVTAGRKMRLVKGSHVILERWWTGDHGYVLQSPDRRIVFVNPYLDTLALVGTTDVPYDGPPEAAECSEDEMRYLVDILNRYFRTSHRTRDVLWHYSGVRPLFDDDESKSASTVTRDYTLELSGGRPQDGQAPVVSAFGGKLTTFRKLAEQGLERLRPHFPQMGPAWTGSAPLPGGDVPNADFESWFADFRATVPWAGDELARHYARCYGTDAVGLLSDARSLDDLGRHFGGLLYEREVLHLIENEWARSAEDILERRTKHGLFLSDGERDSLQEWLDRGT